MGNLISSLGKEKRKKAWNVGSGSIGANGGGHTNTYLYLTTQRNGTTPSRGAKGGGGK